MPANWDDWESDELVSEEEAVKQIMEEFDCDEEYALEWLYKHCQPVELS